MTVQLGGWTFFTRHRRDKGFHSLEDRLVHSAIIRHSSQLSRSCSWLISPGHRSPCWFSIVTLQSNQRDNKDRGRFQNMVNGHLPLRQDPGKKKINGVTHFFSNFKLLDSLLPQQSSPKAYDCEITLLQAHHDTMNSLSKHYALYRLPRISFGNILLIQYLNETEVG